MIVFYFRRSTFSNMLLTLVRQLLAIHITFRYIVISVCEERLGITWTITEICSSDSKLLIKNQEEVCVRIKLLKNYIHWGSLIKHNEENIYFYERDNSVSKHI